MLNYSQLRLPRALRAMPRTLSAARNHQLGAPPPPLPDEEPVPPPVPPELDVEVRLTVVTFGEPVLEAVGNTTVRRIELPVSVTTSDEEE